MINSVPVAMTLLKHKNMVFIMYSHKSLNLQAHTGHIGSKMSKVNSVGVLLT